MSIIVNDTPVTLWQEVVRNAAGTCTIRLKEDLESYLVFLLMRFSKRPEFAKDVVAPEFLEGLNSSNQTRKVLLQEVGDKCLIFSGLFPLQSEKRLVKINYFVRVGQSAYMMISESRDDTYHLLSKHFVPLMDILQAIRQYNADFPDLLPINAYELWNETGSKRALKVLEKYTKSIPVGTRPL